MDLKSKDGVVGMFETVAKWSQGEGKPQASRTGTFKAAHSASAFVDYLNSLPKGLDDKGESNSVPTMATDGSVGPLTLGYAFDCFLYGLDLKVKARLRPAAGADSPWITRTDPKTEKSIKINLATGERQDAKSGEVLAKMPIEKCIAAVNAGIAAAVALGDEPQGAVVVARKMLIESKVAKEQNGNLVVAK